MNLAAQNYDAIFCHQCLHHVAKLEKLFRELLSSIKPDGLFLIDEFIGPSSNEWNDAAMEPAKKVYEQIAPELRRISELPAPIVPSDPSEGIRASEILPQLQIGFELDEFRPYGGNLLALICPQIDWERAPGHLIEDLIEAEGKYLQDGVDSHHALIVARPKYGRRRLSASLRYFLEPKFKRMVRELSI